MGADILDNQNHWIMQFATIKTARLCLPQVPGNYADDNVVPLWSSIL